MNSLKSCMTILDHTGDSTFAWTETQDQEIRAIIQNMLNRGYVFYVPKKFFGEKPLTPELLSRRQITLRGSSESEFYKQYADLISVNRPAAAAQYERTTDVSKIASSQSVARLQAQGG